jgi:hypothetical protein
MRPIYANRWLTAVSCLLDDEMREYIFILSCEILYHFPIFGVIFFEEKFSLVRASLSTRSKAEGGGAGSLEPFEREAHGIRTASPEFNSDLAHLSALCKIAPSFSTFHIFHVCTRH